MVVPLGKVMRDAVLLDKVCHWSVEFIAHFQFTLLLCVCGQRCDLSFPPQPPAAISPQLFWLEAKISSFFKLHWSWCFTIATESYQSKTWASHHLLAPLF